MTDQHADAERLNTERVCVAKVPDVKSSMRRGAISCDMRSTMVSGSKGSVVGHSIRRAARRARGRGRPGAVLSRDSNPSRWTSPFAFGWSGVMRELTMLKTHAGRGQH